MMPPSISYFSRVAAYTFLFVWGLLYYTAMFNRLGKSYTKTIESRAIRNSWKIARFFYTYVNLFLYLLIIGDFKLENKISSLVFINIADILILFYISFLFISSSCNLNPALKLLSLRTQISMQAPQRVNPFPSPFHHCYTFLSLLSILPTHQVLRSLYLKRSIGYFYSRIICHQFYPSAFT